MKRERKKERKKERNNGKQKRRNEDKEETTRLHCHFFYLTFFREINNKRKRRVNRKCVRESSR